MTAQEGFEMSRTDGLNFLLAYRQAMCTVPDPNCPADAEAYLAELEADGGEFLTSDEYINREISPETFTYE